MNRALLLTPAFLAVTACHVRDRPEHRWIGPLTSTKPDPQCPPTKGVLLLRQDVVTFAPDEGTWILTGTAAAKTLTATQSRPTSDHKTYKTDLQADWNDTAVHGTYTTPACTYGVELTNY